MTSDLQKMSRGCCEKSSASFAILKDNFETIATAKGGIPKLRELILQLAVQGKLIPQNPEDEPASVLLKKIQTEKARLVKEGKIKKQKALPPVDLDDVPYELPEGWVWTRLDEIVTKIGSGSTPRGGKSVYQDVGIPFIRSQNVWNEGLKLDIVAYIPKEVHQNMSGTFVKAKDILLNITGASIGRSSLVSDDFIEGNVSQHVSIIRSVDENVRHFLHLLIISPYFQNMIMNQQVGISREGLSKKILELFVIPLPPLAEQHRIVERMDTLMQLCDELEARQDTESERRQMLLLSSLNALFDAKEPDGAAAAREILLANFDLLFDDTESIAELRKTILQLAVQGRLVEQNPGDEPASVLLERIQAEKMRLVKEGKIKKQKALPPVKVSDVPYELPEGWVWTRFGDIIQKIQSGGTPNKINPQYWDGEIFWASVKDLNTSKYLNSTQDKITKKAIDESKSKIIPANNLIICVRMGLGKIAINQIDVAINQDLKGVELFDNIDINYVYNFFSSSTIEGSGMTVKGIRQEELLGLFFPLPPLAEQHRIVERVDTLMNLCDELEERVSAKEDAAERLLLSVCDGICG